ncbi:TrkA family potassium uptake protein [Gordonia sp. (in: high G+C Gram-positive bacteria)]|uniref:potassium channel family protein n=1 Tax=Gordonia sp. (in: high G+C Gram-positive bacteria) TaxID=84139 RepID=UPI0016AB5C04|nr:TrkA family potassium uptake protein [Gordonia sp. (in: high G+C Gram-positive bacteria)]NLG48337.1 TrkA family potassium uptake protein [Gordonia sp. (in: high G+C Gram-positive bacteria)]
MRVIIMGCGRVGSALAKTMSKLNHEVVVIDRDETAFRRLGPDFDGRTVTGVGFDRDVLDEAGIAQCDAFAAVSSGDNSNIIAARVARETFDVERVVARIYDAKRAAVFERLGIPTVATVTWTTQRFVAALGETSTTPVWHDPSGELVMAVLEFHESWVGADTARFQELTGARVAFLSRMGQTVLPDPRTVIQDEDVLYAAVLVSNVDHARAVAGAQMPRE